MSVHDEYVWLECEIVKETDYYLDVKVKQYDGTEGILKVNPVLVEHGKHRRGKVKVEPIGETGDKYAVKLPRPTLEFGHHITVNTSQISIP
jgi:hypothetical protein